IVARFEVGAVLRDCAVISRHENGQARHSAEPAQQAREAGARRGHPHPSAQRTRSSPDRHPRLQDRHRGHDDDQGILGNHQSDRERSAAAPKPRGPEQKEEEGGARPSVTTPAARGEALPLAGLLLRDAQLGERRAYWFPFGTGRLPTLLMRLTALGLVHLDQQFAGGGAPFGFPPYSRPRGPRRTITRPGGDAIMTNEQLE